MLRALVVALALTSGACSVLFMETESPKWTPAKEPRCTATAGWPLWDFAITTAVGGGGALLFADARSRYDRGEISDEHGAKLQSSGVLMMLAGSLHLASGVVGVVRVNDCQKARRQRDAFLRRHPQPRAPTKTQQQLELDELRRRVRELERQRPAPPTPVEPAPAPAPLPPQ